MLDNILLSVVYSELQ